MGLGHILVLHLMSRMSNPAAVGLVDANPLAISCWPVPDSLGFISLDAMCFDLWEEPFLWHLIECLLKIQVDKVREVVVVSMFV